MPLESLPLVGITSAPNLASHRLQIIDNRIWNDSAMSILRRIKRYVRAQRIPEPSTMDRVGMGGEQYADQFLAHPLVLSRIANPVLPPSECS